MRESLKIEDSSLKGINQLLNDPDNQLVQDLLKIMAKYGTPSQINKMAREARNVDNICKRLAKIDSPYLHDLEWLMKEKEKGSFIAIPDFRRSVLGENNKKTHIAEENAVVLEISALQYFPWLIAQAHKAIAAQEIMPARYIRVRNMKEQENDQGDILAIAAAMQIIGASYVESLDTRGTDGSNIHLGGPDTITGYFGGIGQPNEYPLKWADELLYYYTQYGICEYLNVNAGTVLVGLMLYKLGIDVRFKLSVFTGHDNSFAILWTLMLAQLLSREDGTNSIAGINFSNSVNDQTIIQSAKIRKALGMENSVRFEHHITETYKSIVCQPYNRRDQLLRIAPFVQNIAAKHEGADPEIDQGRAHPSDILDYFRTKKEIIEAGDMEHLYRNYLDKHDALNKTARLLTENGLAFIGASKLHRQC